MKNITALWTVALLFTLSSGATAGEHTTRFGRFIDIARVDHMEAPPQAAKTPQWKSREEYDALMAANNEKDPNKKISLAEAFIEKFSNSDYKSTAYLLEMQAYQQLNQTDKALDAARKALDADPDNLQALRALCFAFPFLYKPAQADAAAALSRADSNAHHGLDLLQKLQKPQGANEDQFQQAVKDLRSVFNNCTGFVALQNKSYANAITAFKAAETDNPSNVYTYYWMGLAYLYSAPPDNDNAIWYLARAVSLANASKNSSADEINTFLKRAYMNYHGTDTGLSDIMTQAASSPDPPAGFKVAKAEPQAKTGNNVVDAFNTLTYPLKLGGDTAQKQWDGVKGQPIALGGTVQSVEKGTDPGVYLVRIAVLDSTKATDLYDIELKDSTQANVKNLQKGDLLTFKGTLESYVATPNLILTLAGEVTSDLPDKPPAKPPAHHPTHRATS